MSSCNCRRAHVMGPKVFQDLCEDLLIGKSARTPDPDSPDTERHQSSNFQELGPDCAALGTLKLGPLETDPTQLGHQQVGHTGKPQAQMVC